MFSRSSWLGVAILGLLASAAPAHAETPPWSVGVSEGQKTNAQGFLQAGNALFLDKKYAEALEKYKAAVAQWDHPAIRFNIVRCLIQLDRPVDASDNLKLALTFGAAPLEDAVYTEALAYEKLLANQIADLSIDCSQPGVKITLDGQPLGTCPAKETRRVSPGQHQLVGTKQGFLTRTIEVVAIGGKQQSAMISLEPLEKAARIEHRWAQWVPWGVFVGGFAVAGFGTLVNVSAGQDMDRYDASVARNCPTVACKTGSAGPDDPGPFLPASDADLKGRAELKTAIGVSLMVVGGATVATGAVMLYMNRGRTVYPDSVERMTPSISPMPGGAAFSLSGAF